MNEWEWQLLEDKTVLTDIEIQGVPVRRGDRVRLRPRAGGDIFDLALTGKTAVVESLEQDYEGKLHVGVVVDDDPGRDVGLMRQPGHRFFFMPEELEPVGPSENNESPAVPCKKVLVAGIGNIFLADDGFGVEVATRLRRRSFPAGVHVADFGIRGFDLAYALMEGYETTILIDAFPSDAPPGTLHLLEPDLSELTTTESQSGLVEPHAMNPINVLRMAAEMGATLKRVLLVGCVPATFGPEEGQMGLSEPVAVALDEAETLVISLVFRILNGEWPRKEGSEFKSARGDCHGDGDNSSNR